MKEAICRVHSFKKSLGFWGLNGTTAAERFFESKPINMFESLFSVQGTSNKIKGEKWLKLMRFSSL
ncbi:hypothetical protein [uncultured Desulfobacter sp.]|uniref:hypothetical protein n=1 Tax=uncultured Desulfobacter sp. TaxID=240139 RepID=UPI0029C7C21F|nr:hypothetical protein [uncultured Desulfobacter sp.]